MKRKHDSESWRYKMYGPEGEKRPTYGMSKIPWFVVSLKPEIERSAGFFKNFAQIRGYVDTYFKEFGIPIPYGLEIVPWEPLVFKENGKSKKYAGFPVPFSLSSERYCNLLDNLQQYLKQDGFAVRYEILPEVQHAGLAGLHKLGWKFVPQT